MKIQKIKIGTEFVYPATITNAVKDAATGKTIQQIVGSLNDLQTTEKGSLIGAINEIKNADTTSAVVGDATTNGDTLGKVEDRIETIETALNVAGTDQSTIDKVDEVLTWFAGVEETDPAGAAVIVAASAVGKEKVEEVSHQATAEEAEAFNTANAEAIDQGEIAAMQEGDTVVDVESAEATGLIKKVEDLESALITLEDTTDKTDYADVF